MISVSSNGRTVWVNSPTDALARFCPLSQEYFDKGAVTTIVHPGGESTEEYWELFCRRVRECYGVAIEEKHRPKGCL
jgi:hypothetical protein